MCHVRRVSSSPFFAGAAGAAGAIVAATVLSVPARAQIANPADKARAQSTEPQKPDESNDQHTPTYAMPPIEVRGQKVSPLREEDLIGDYKQPRWTAKRRFAETRIYVIPEGKVEFEWWARVEARRHGKPTMQNQYEWEFGLPGRLQLDLYAVSNQTIDTGAMEFDEQKIEMRYALANWGELWGNPAVYLEWDQQSNAADVIETKFLLGDEASVGWHWGANLVWEQTIGDNHDSEYGLTLGLSHTLKDEKLSLGGEIKSDIVDTSLDRGNFTKEFEIGPSLQWRPVPAMHLDFVPLFGIGADSRMFDIFVVLGWEF